MATQDADPLPAGRVLAAATLLTAVPWLGTLLTLSDPNAPVATCQRQCLGYDLFAPTPAEAVVGIGFVVIVVGATVALRWRD